MIMPTVPTSASPQKGVGSLNSRRTVWLSSFTAFTSR